MSAGGGLPPRSGKGTVAAPLTFRRSGLSQPHAAALTAAEERDALRRHVSRDGLWVGFAVLPFEVQAAAPAAAAGLYPMAPQAIRTAALPGAIAALARGDAAPGLRGALLAWRDPDASELPVAIEALLALPTLAALFVDAPTHALAWAAASLADAGPLPARLAQITWLASRRLGEGANVATHDPAWTFVARGAPGLRGLTVGGLTTLEATAEPDGRPIADALRAAPALERLTLYRVGGATSEALAAAPPSLRLLVLEQVVPHVPALPPGLEELRLGHAALGPAPAAALATAAPAGLHTLELGLVDIEPGAPLAALVAAQIVTLRLHLTAWVPPASLAQLAALLRAGRLLETLDLALDEDRRVLGGLEMAHAPAELVAAQHAALAGATLVGAQGLATLRFSQWLLPHVAAAWAGAIGALPALREVQLAHVDAEAAAVLAGAARASTSLVRVTLLPGAGPSSEAALRDAGLAGELRRNRSLLDECVECLLLARATR